MFADWNKGELDSYLIEISRDIFAKKDEDGQPLVDKILDTAARKGTGKWTVISALDTGQPVTLIGESVFARCLVGSQGCARRCLRGALKGPKAKPVGGDRAAFIENVRRALYRSKIISYAAGIPCCRAARRKREWLEPQRWAASPLMWRGGCIIRSAFLGDIKAAFDKKQRSSTNLLQRQVLLAQRQQAAGLVAQGGYRRHQARHCPPPAFSTALAFFDGYRAGRLPANLLQAQRD